MNELALFAGAGGGILGGEILGWRCVCAVEWNAYAASVLAARQNEGLLPPFPIWDDVRSFDGRAWRGLVDVVSGGFPCKGVSTAGPGTAFDHPETALWTEQARIIREVEPAYALVENSAALSARGLGRVLGDLASMGFDAEWGVISAGEVGAPHDRERMWIVATHPDRAQRQGGELPGRAHPKYPDFGGRTWWKDQPDVDRVDDGVAARVDRLVAIGNGQVPHAAALAWTVLRGRLNE